jgi:hypothetical protein
MGSVLQLEPSEPVDDEQYDLGCGSHGLRKPGGAVLDRL